MSALSRYVRRNVSIAFVASSTAPISSFTQGLPSLFDYPRPEAARLTFLRGEIIVPLSKSSGNLPALSDVQARALLFSALAETYKELADPDDTGVLISGFDVTPNLERALLRLLPDDAVAETLCILLLDGMDPAEALVAAEALEAGE